MYRASSYDSGRASEDLMIIELNDDETRLLYNALLAQAVEHLRYANPSELAERLYELATRFKRPVRTTGITTA